MKIVVKNQNCGFFSNFNYAISVLAYADEMEVKCEIDWSSNWESTDFSYGTKNGNIWGKLFDGLEKTDDEEQDVKVLLSTNYWNHKLMYEKEQRMHLHRIYKKYIKLKKHILDRVERFYVENLKGNDFIGLHLRHPGHAIEQYDRGMPSIADYEKIMAQNVEKYPIFIASDMQDICDYFKSKFGSNIKFQQDVIRTSYDAQIQLHRNNAEPDLKLAEDVLSDCLLLSKSYKLFGVFSNITGAACYINPDLEFELIQISEPDPVTTNANSQINLNEKNPNQIFSEPTPNLWLISLTEEAIQNIPKNVYKYQNDKLFAWEYNQDIYSDFEKASVGDWILFCANVSSSHGVPTIQWCSQLKEKPGRINSNNQSVFLLSKPLSVSILLVDLWEELHSYYPKFVLPSHNWVTRIDPSPIEIIVRQFGSFDSWIHRVVKAE